MGGFDHGVTVGEVLGGKYRVEATLGAGGMGYVVAARHVDLGQCFAIKRMRPEVAQNAEAVQRFLREARAAAGLRSEHVARVHDVGRLEDGSPFMVMEHLVGTDLDKVLRQRGPLPIGEAVDYVLQACEAVAEAHSVGIVHRDLKPGNLFLTHRPDGSTLVKVLDFGMSKVVAEAGVSEASLTGDGALLGSPWYMAPEQVRCSKVVDHRADVWSLGVIVHRLLAGRPPFDAPTLAACLARVVADPPTRLREARPDAPAELEAVILACLEKDVERRTQNVAELAWALAPFSPASSHVSIERITRVLLGADAFTERMSRSSGGGAVPSLPRPAEASGASSSVATAAVAVSTMGSTSTLASTILPVELDPVARRRARTRVLAALGAVVLAAVAAVVALGREGAGAAAVEGAAVSASGAPAPPPAATPSVPVPAAAASVEVRLRLDPPGARVEIDGAVRAERPVRLTRSADEHRLVASAPGFVTMTRTFRADADVELGVALERAKPSPERAASPPKPEPPPKPAKPRVAGPIETTL